jgi:hypothetical protein
VGSRRGQGRRWHSLAAGGTASAREARGECKGGAASRSGWRCNPIRGRCKPIWVALQPYFHRARHVEGGQRGVEALLARALQALALPLLELAAARHHLEQLLLVPARVRVGVRVRVRVGVVPARVRVAGFRGFRAGSGSGSGPGSGPGSGADRASCCWARSLCCLAKSEEMSLASALRSLPPRAATRADAPTTSTVAASKLAIEPSSSSAACGQVTG